MQTTDWKDIAECKYCQHHVSEHSSHFLDICPACGERQSHNWFLNTLWKIRTARFVSHETWWKPSTWNNGVIQFEDGEQRVIKKGKIVDTIKPEEGKEEVEVEA